MAMFKPLSINELSFLEKLTIKGKPGELYNFLDKNDIRFDADPMTKDGYSFRQQGETLLNYIFKIEDKEKAKKTNEVLLSFGASRYRGKHYEEPPVTIPIQSAQAHWN